MDLAEQAQRDDERQEGAAALLLLGGVTPRAYMEQAPTRELSASGFDLYLKGEMGLARQQLAYLLENRTAEMDILEETKAAIEIVRRADRLLLSDTNQLLAEARERTGENDIYADCEALHRYLLQERSDEISLEDRGDLNFHLGCIAMRKMEKILSQPSELQLTGAESGIVLMFMAPPSQGADKIASYSAEAKECFEAAIDSYKDSCTPLMIRGVYAYANLTVLSRRLGDDDGVREYALRGLELCARLEEQGLIPRDPQQTRTIDTIRNMFIDAIE